MLKILFQGDSLTDCGRDKTGHNPVQAYGFVSVITTTRAAIRITAMEAVSNTFFLLFFRLEIIIFSLICYKLPTNCNV